MRRASGIRLALTGYTDAETPSHAKEDTLRQLLSGLAVIALASGAVAVAGTSAHAAATPKCTAPSYLAWYVPSTGMYYRKGQSGYGKGSGKYVCHKPSSSSMNSMSHGSMSHGSMSHGSTTGTSATGGSMAAPSAAPGGPGSASGSVASPLPGGAGYPSTVPGGAGGAPGAPGAGGTTPNQPAGGTPSPAGATAVPMSSSAPH